MRVIFYSLDKQRMEKIQRFLPRAWSIIPGVTAPILGRIWGDECFEAAENNIYKSSHEKKDQVSY